MKLKLKRPAKLTGKKKLILLLILIIVLAAVFHIFRGKKAKSENSAVSERNITKVARGSFSNEMTSSGSLSPKDTYSITSLVEGEILEADFEEGDQVKKDQVLFVIDPADAEKDLTSAERSLKTAENDYADALEEYEKGIGKLNEGVYLSDASGYIKDLTIKNGDSIGGNRTDAGILYDDSTMTVKLPFLSAEADLIPTGADIVLIINDTGEALNGTVRTKASKVESLPGGTLVKYITVNTKNPGGLTSSDSATAVCGALKSAGSGYFEAYRSDTLEIDLPVSVKIEKVLVSDGQYVKDGTGLFTITADSLKTAVNSLEKDLRQAENALINAQDKVEQMKDALSRYTIKAPISGQVITKNSKAGDNISRSSGNSSTTMALIYDLSELTFRMSIDELDISNIKVGQEVIVTADAFEKETFRGHVTNVSLDGSSSNGVTTYPVTITLDEKGGLLPAMNVNGTIILNRVTDVLYIPVSALNRGSIVYVKGSAPEGSETVEKSAAPEGFTAVRVQTGLVTDDYVEIISGLSEGQEIYVNDADSAVNFLRMPGGNNGRPGMPGGAMPGGGMSGGNRRRG